MKKLFSRGGGLLAGLALSACLFATGVYALIVPQAFPARQFPTQQVHYLRFTVNFNDCVLVSNTCSVRRGAVPYNAYILRANQSIITSFNSGTTDTIALGTTSGGAQLVAAQSVHGAAGGGTALTVVAANIGTAATGGGATQTGAAPTAGQAVYVIEYIAPNDGSCGPVALGATAGAC